VANPAAAEERAANEPVKAATDSSKTAQN